LGGFNEAATFQSRKSRISKHFSLSIHRFNEAATFQSRKFRCVSGAETARVNDFETVGQGVY
jgi:hypothetical protein